MTLESSLLLETSGCRYQKLDAVRHSDVRIQILQQMWPVWYRDIRNTEGQFESRPVVVKATSYRGQSEKTQDDILENKKKIFKTHRHNKQNYKLHFHLKITK